MYFLNKNLRFKRLLKIFCTQSTFYFKGVLTKFRFSHQGSNDNKGLRNTALEQEYRLAVM
jgi:hypothetical protein